MCSICPMRHTHTHRRRLFASMSVQTTTISINCDRQAEINHLFLLRWEIYVNRLSTYASEIVLRMIDFRERLISFYHATMLWCSLAVSKILEFSKSHFLNLCFV
ncbi:hypothetical protein Tsp_03728 [Trichinella spiralis]|uniref:hypothetical protein n=1 Tax=Trichinella spiralis TaxID=6334 RepID=UPI0001EFBB0F|nr:hypothetical protein Tsp_03728 [Trichinella spiralis]